MKYLLDANTCIEFLRERDSAVKRNLAKVNLQDVALCSVVKAELYYTHEFERVPILTLEDWQD